jgi:hypothetical protein
VHHKQRTAPRLQVLRLHTLPQRSDARSFLRHRCNLPVQPSTRHRLLTTTNTNTNNTTSTALATSIDGISVPLFPSP